MVLEQRDQSAIQDRLQTELIRSGLDALIVTAPESIFYCTGFASNFLYTSGQIGIAAAVVKKEGPVTLILNEFEKQAAQSSCKGIELQTYPVWIYIEDYADESGKEKPAQPDLNQVFAMAAEVILDSYPNPKVGLEMETISHSKWDYLCQVFGQDHLFDAGPTLVESRAIKTPWEIDVLRRGANIAEIAMYRTAHTIEQGMTEAEVMAVFRKNCEAQSPEVISTIQAHTLGSDFAPAIIPRHTKIKRGDIIRIDGGPFYCGYCTDIARTFALGPRTEKRREEIYAALWKGYETGRNMLGPGVRMCDVFAAMQKVIRENGIPGYIRGHHGHSIGCCRFSEEYPFLSGKETRPLEPGMVMCLEVPYYSSKNHSYNIEDMFLITENGAEFFSNACESLYL